MSTVTRFTTDPGEARRAMVHLRHLLPDAERPLFDASISSFLDDALGYRILVAAPAQPAAVAELCGAAMVTVIRSPMTEVDLLLVDCIWSDGAEETDDRIWRHLIQEAQTRDCVAICVPSRAPGAESQFLRGRGADRRSFRGRPAGYFPQVLVQLGQRGLWTSVNEGPSLASAQFLQCILIETLDTEERTAQGARVTARSTTAYRGEGRLDAGAYASCTDLHALIDEVMRVGFVPRADESFGGTLREQLLHQGYVDQGTVSLTASTEVAEIYARAGTKRPAGVVFEVDVAGLNCNAPVYDGMQTLRNHCDWMFQSDHETIEQALQVLGVRAGGRFLETLYAVTHDRVATGITEREALEGGSSSRLAAIPNELRDRLIGVIEPTVLDGALQSLEAYWMYALGQVGSVDRIDARTGDLAEVRSLVREPFLFERTFRDVHDHLDAALKVRRSEPDRRRGWDLTAFGYMAKAILDRELFASGGVPPEFIRSATIVPAGDQRGETIPPGSK